MSGVLTSHVQAVLSLAASDAQLGYDCPLCGARSWICGYANENETAPSICCLRCGFVARIAEPRIPEWVSRYKAMKGIEKPEKESIDAAVEMKAKAEESAEHRGEHDGDELPEKGRAKSVFRRLFDF